jgi:ribosome maturation factor RimP
MSTTSLDDLWQLIGPFLEAERLELDDLELVGLGRGRTLRVVVDAQGGVDVERLGAVAQDLSRLLDAETDLEGPYQLEVTSPGLERRLRRPSHFVKSVGREVVVKTTGGTLLGVLVEAGDRGLVVREGEVDHPVAYEAVREARTRFRWERPQRPGGRR